jgi:S-adenosylmethionine synthetase
MSDAEIAAVLKGMKNEFDMRPKAIIERLKLLQPMYTETAAYGHMGRKYELKVKKFESLYNQTREVEVELFTWEKLNRTEMLRAAFGLS